MKVLFTISLCIFIFATVLFATPYEVLVVDIAETGNREKIEGFKEDAVKFNALQQKGYSAAKPYFNVLQMANGRTYFVFGFKDQVQGVHPENYPGTFRNLRRLKNEGAQMYPNMRWVSVEKIRRLMVAPFPFESQAAD